LGETGVQSPPLLKAPNVGGLGAGDLGGCAFSSERVRKGNFTILPKHPPDKSLKPLRCLGCRIKNPIMEQIKDILANLTFNSPSNGTLHPMVQNAIAKSKIPVNTLGCSVVFHVPASKFSDAKPHIHQLIEPFGGFNASLSDGNWFDDRNNCWCPEPIILVKSYATLDVLQQHLTATLQQSYLMGKALGESAIAVEIITNNVMLMIPTD